jgi:hypothetical protein
LRGIIACAGILLTAGDAANAIAGHNEHTKIKCPCRRGETDKNLGSRGIDLEGGWEFLRETGRAVNRTLVEGWVEK